MSRDRAEYQREYRAKHRKQLNAYKADWARADRQKKKLAKDDLSTPRN